MRRLAFLLALVVAAGITAGATAQPRGDTLAVVVRVDDVQSRSTIAPRSLVPFQSAVEARGAKVSWLVIPNRLAEPQNTAGPDAGVLEAELRASVARGHEVGMHGWIHICPVCGSTNHEFYCSARAVAVADTTQRRRLDASLALLRDRLGVTPTAWVAPGHDADGATHRLLAERGLRVVSTHASAEGTLAGQRNLRTSADYAWQLTAATYAAQRTAVLADARTRGRAQGVYVLLLHDPFTRPGYANGLVVRWAGEVLDSLRREHPVRFLTMTEADAWLARPATGTAASSGDAAPLIALAATPSVSRGPVTLRATLPDGVRHLRLDLIDALGRSVARLYDGPPDPNATWTWNASAVPPGLYLARLATDHGIATARVVVAR